MFIKKAKYHSDISEAYTRGLEQGFELARRLKQNHELRKQESPCFSNSLTMTQSGKPSLLSKQLADIAKSRGIDLE